MKEKKQHKLKPTATERRRLTRNSIYRFIYSSAKPVSKQEIADALDVSLPTVHQNISELLEAGYIRAGEVKKSTGGRPPLGYEANPDIRYTVGAAVTSNHFRFWAGNLKQEELGFKSVRIPNAQLDEIKGDALKREMDIFLEESGLDPAKLLGVGITIPGVFDSESEQIVLSPTLKMKNFNISDFVKEAGIPTAIMNDSSCAGYEERRMRQLSGQSLDFVYLLLENGIGGAIFMDGKQIRGKNGRSGEFGHMRIVPDGRVCNCGQRGCLEAYCSAFRITRDFGISVEQFFDEMEKEQGKGPKTALFYDMLRYLSIGIVNLRMAFDCEIVLGGFMTEFLGPFMDFLRTEVKRLDPFGADADYLKIAASPKASLQGAAWYHVGKFINQI